GAYPRQANAAGAGARARVCQRRGGARGSAGRRPARAVDGQVRARVRGRRREAAPAGGVRGQRAPHRRRQPGGQPDLHARAQPVLRPHQRGVRGDAPRVPSPARRAHAGGRGERVHGSAAVHARTAWTGGPGAPSPQSSTKVTAGAAGRSRRWRRRRGWCRSPPATSSPCQSSRCSIARAAPTAARVASSTPALTYITASGGLQTEAAYTYNAKQGACRSGGLSPNPAASVGVHRSVTLHGDEGALQVLVASQPVAVAVEADADFHHYRSGVYVGSPSCGRNLHHAVTVVGYGDGGWRAGVLGGEEPMGGWVGRGGLHAPHARERQQLRHCHLRPLPHHGQLL
ncbi:hypothetical protein CFC21_015070, partial [Triticum aestivum]